MLRPRPIRRSGFVSTALIGAAFSIAATAQTSTLPATAPTAQVSPLSATATQSDAATRTHRAEVEYADGLLSINANNSSLNQILREISRQTGMKITGGVREERVFGHYGPSAPEIILKTLIDGTSTNMVLRETASNQPEELILTPRAGGATPPNPNAQAFDNSREDDDERRAPDQRPRPPFNRPVPGRVSNPVQIQPQLQPSSPASVPPSVPQPANNVNGSPFNTSPTASTLPVTNSVPVDAIPTPSTTPPANGIVDAPNPPDPGTVNPVTTNPPVNPNPPAGTDATDPNANNGVKTPEQIYEQLQQLQKMRQQQQQGQPTTITPQ